MISYPKRALAVASLMTVLATGCGDKPSPKAQLLQQMHKLTPNTPDEDIESDADVVCTHANPAARRALLDDSLAGVNGLNGLTFGSAALGRYVDRIIQVAHDVGYC